MSTLTDTTTEPETKPFDTVGFIIEFEDGALDEEQIISGFQHLIDSGAAWQLQGCYGRTAAALIEAGHCTAPGRNEEPEAEETYEEDRDATSAELISGKPHPRLH